MGGRTAGAARKGSRGCCWWYDAKMLRKWKKYTPRKINIEPENDALEDDYLLFQGYILRFLVNLPGCNSVCFSWQLCSIISDISTYFARLGFVALFKIPDILRSFIRRIHWENGATYANSFPADVHQLTCCDSSMLAR